MRSRQSETAVRTPSKVSKVTLGGEPAHIGDKMTIRSNYAVARRDDGDRILAVGARLTRTGCSRLSHRLVRRTRRRSSPSQTIATSPVSPAIRLRLPTGESVHLKYRVSWDLASPNSSATPCSTEPRFAATTKKLTGCWHLCRPATRRATVD